MPVPLVPLVFVGIGAIFLGAALRNDSPTGERQNPARRARLRVGFIFVAVGVGLAVMHALVR